MVFSFKHATNPDAADWRSLSVVDASQLWIRWKSAQKDKTKRFSDSLLDDDRSEDGNHWVVKSRIELVRLIGALQFYNQRASLWFRGENRRFKESQPRRYRTGGKGMDAVLRGMEWIQTSAERSALLRDRSPLARLAILQHYNVPTSLLDVSASIDVAAAFAFLAAEGDERPPDSHVRVFVTPRVTDSINLFRDLGACVVDLVAELPSYCLRPHVQRAAFLGHMGAVRSDLGDSMGWYAQLAGLDDLCIAHLKLTGSPREYLLQHPLREALFPAPSNSCRHCRDGTLADDLCGDLLLHKLRCLCSGGAPVEGFPK